ncbi:ATP-binding protein [Prevotella multiformis]|uniref:ATP-binding protein n=1 Tax=Prevotella multiformis TaxID=282402 RepID=UPI001BAD8668|nr:AAA family ATPase [Prevotella multiformis]QUB71725.1 ATP-binding protein [Prevotella multiformis]
MEQNDVFPLLTTYHRRLAMTDMRFMRFLHDRINWRSRLIGIRGSRGAGKTTLLLQHIKQSFANVDDAIWISLDNIWFKTHSLPELIEYFYSHGLKHLFVDEVHKYPDWVVVLKNIYDSYPDLNVAYTGSSMLEIDNSKTDLSRRQSLYTLPVMSFREYLAFTGIVEVAPLTLEDLLRDHVALSMDLASKGKMLKTFGEYLDKGCYPFFLEAGDDYYMRLAATASLVIESDMPAVENVSYATVEKTKKLLAVIVQSVPLVPNVNKLGQALETTRDSCLKMLYTLDKAQIISLLTKVEKNYKHLSSPEKIYLGNTNLMAALGTSVNIGNRRETFFNNQLQAVANVTMPQIGDFLVNDKYLFEMGGASKSFEQIKDEPNSFLAIDDIEMGSGNRIPLWMFGLLY